MHKQLSVRAKFSTTKYMMNSKIPDVPQLLQREAQQFFNFPERVLDVAPTYSEYFLSTREKINQKIPIYFSTFSLPTNLLLQLLILRTIYNVTISIKHNFLHQAPPLDVSLNIICYSS